MTKTLYLTIDDAPSEDCIHKLDFLDEHDIKAIWFAEGRYLEARPDIASEMIKRGHILGNHAFSHPYFSDISIDNCITEIEKTDKLLRQIYDQAGVEWTHRYFRFPFGDKGIVGTAATQPTYDVIQSNLKKLDYTQPTWNDITYAYFKDAGLHQVYDWYWTYDSLDWCAYSDHPVHGYDTPDKVLARIDEDVPDGGRGINYADSADIVLVHDHVTPDNLFQQIITKLLTKDVVFRLPT